MSNWSKSLLIGVIIFLAFSCKKEASWDIDATVPIAKSQLDINHFFGDTIFNSDPTGLLHINFSKTLLNYTIDSLAKLPDTTIKSSFTSFFDHYIDPNTQVYTNSLLSDKEVTFDVANGIELNKAKIRKGILKVELSNTFSGPLNFIYELNSASLWGNTLKVNLIAPGGSTLAPSVITQTYSLENYDVDLRGSTLNKVNTLVQNYEIRTLPSSPTTLLAVGEGLNMKISFLGVIPEYAQGYFGQQSLSIPKDSAFVSFFENFNPNGLLLTQASINFNIINEFGVELSSNISNVKSIKTNPRNVVSLSPINSLQSINVNRASKTNNTSNPVFPWVKTIFFNTTNSNLNAFIENLPNYLGFSADTKLNPLGNISGSNDFAYYGHGLKVTADVDIPLSLSANYFSLIKYSKIDLSKAKQLDNVNDCEIVLFAKNNFPFRAQIQGYLLNDKNQVIDSLFIPGQNYVQAALSDLSNNVIAPNDSKLVVSFSKEKLDKLKLCKQIKFISYLFLSNQPTPIKLTEKSYLDLVVNANVNYKAKTK